MSSTPFRIGWYNGWSPEERCASIPVQREAVASGTIPRPRTCSICRAGWSRDNPVWLHDEDYGRPLDSYPICRRCHRILHDRFEEPDAWLALVEAYRRPGVWFELLTMDPASLRRPFRETYPDGLPPREES